MADPTDSKVAEVYARIQTQRRIMEGNQALRAATSNPDVIRQAESQIREAQRNISYLQESLNSLKSRRASGGPGFRTDSPTGSTTPADSRQSFASTKTSAGSSISGARPYPGDSSSSYHGGSNPPSPAVNPRRYDGRPVPPGPENAPVGAPDGSYAQYANQDPYSDGAGYPQAGPETWQPAMHRMGTSARRNYTNLDLIKDDTPHTTAKISRMLHQLEFKLQIEKQYKQGIDKMAKLYQAEGDRKSRNDAESKRIESQSKIVLLQQALKRYKQLHVMEEEEDKANPESVENRKQNLRKPLSGTLQISIRSARDIDHAPVPRGTRSVRESTVVIKVEDTPRARTHPSRNERWQEDFEIPVDNANELEVTVYDKIGSAHPVPVGMLWIRISDIVEEQRKKKFGQVPDASQHGHGPSEGWVTADSVQLRAGGGPYAPGTGQASDGGAYNTPAGAPVPNGPSDGVEAWFAIEPAGAIYLQLNFIKQNVRKRPYDARLGRQGAFRKRKEDIAEINGHKFVSRQFYQVLRCALCGEFLLNAAGSQCEDCRYTCHKKCAQKVVTKCISKSNAEADRDEVKLNHRIPHRFEPITNLSANWCCHCGYILPLGRKNARKCSECDITCHTDCAHLVPDFCGMSMEMANQLLSDIETINRVKSSAQTKSQQSMPVQHVAQQQPLPQQGAFGQNGIGGGPGALPGRIPPPQLPPLAGTGGFANLDKQTQQMSLNNNNNNNINKPGIVEPQYTSSPSQRIQALDQQQQSLQQQQGQRPPGAGAPGFGGRPAPPRIEAHQDMSRPPRPLPQPSSNTGSSMQQQQQLQQPYTARPQPPLAYSSQPPPSQPPSHQMQQQQQQQQQTQSVLNVVPKPQFQPALHQQVAAAPAMDARPAGTGAALVGQTQSQPPRMLPSSRRKIGLDDFNFLAVLGKGNFGKVMLAEEKRSGNLYAIKVLKKEFIIENDEVESTKSEKRVFLAAARERHPFLLGLHSCFQTTTRVYFVMEYISGGDLMLHIQREPFTPRRAKFYAAEVLLALEYFHRQGIIYRDLKLDNIMLTLDGHIKVADYGLCKEEMWYGNTTSTFCGTPEFMAPEILLEQRYGRAVDWWAFGILIYEMLLGQAPFRGDDEDEIFDAILEDEPLYPLHMPADSVSILEKLLTRDPAKRLGSGPTDAEEIKAHPFFRDVNWDDMFNKRVAPPFCPTLKNPSDTSWFDTEFTSEKPTLTPVHSVLSAQDQAEFQSFSWTAPHVV
ncbi:probable protein kinase C [Melanopsichium pennsylvanicum]|uniref:protein kinase C n=2 Tax=Melanopsichium pennsylvanicum TaxID=63383 RepID=A0AAJ4XR06_9BASI|nr:probable protein kinase C [Melanopsichium pennsylvanicum 4]SNX86869.1 probable protein kinase C [Melanopsichium pennsylvanicum]